MKEIIRYGLILGVICAMASALLASVNHLTKARILAQAQSEEEAGLKEVMPQGRQFTPQEAADKVAYYKVYDADNVLVGYAFKATGKGYAGAIETLVGMNRDGTINAVKVISQNETPGLGTRVAEEPFTSRFRMKRAADLETVQAISGATISSRAMISAVKKRAEEISALLKNER